MQRAIAKSSAADARHVEEGIDATEAGAAVLNYRRRCFILNQVGSSVSRPLWTEFLYEVSAVAFRS